MLNSKHSNSIENNEKQIKIERLFSDLFFGNIKNEEALCERLLQSSLPKDFTRSQTLIITLSIEKFDEYLKTKFKYGREELYSFISEIAFEDNEYVLFATVMYSYNNIGIVAIQKKREEDLRVTAEKYCQRLTHSLADRLEISSKIKISKEFMSLGQITEGVKSIEITETSKEESVRNEIIEYLSNNYFNDISLADLADYMCYNKVYFCSFYRKHMNENFTTTLNRMRVERAKELLHKPETKASQIFSNIGYKSAPYFYKVFKSFTGKTPAEYQSELSKKNKKE